MKYLLSRTLTFIATYSLLLLALTACKEPPVTPPVIKADSLSGKVLAYTQNDSLRPLGAVIVEVDGIPQDTTDEKGVFELDKKLLGTHRVRLFRDARQVYFDSSLILKDSLILTSQMKIQSIQYYSLELNERVWEGFGYRTYAGKNISQVLVNARRAMQRGDWYEPFGSIIDSGYNRVEVFRNGIAPQNKVIDTVIFLNFEITRNIQRLTFTLPRPILPQKDFVIPSTVGARWEYTYSYSSQSGGGNITDPRIITDIRGTLSLELTQRFQLPYADSVVGTATLNAMQYTQDWVGGMQRSSTASVLTKTAPMLIMFDKAQTGTRIPVYGFSEIAHLLPRTVDTTVGDTIPLLWSAQGGTVQYANGKGVVHARFANTSNPRAGTLVVEIALTSFRGR